MGILGGSGSRRRPQYGTRVFLTRATIHGVVASFWPRPRGRINDTYLRSIHARFQAVTHHVARLNDREVEPLRQALDAHNRAHEGLTGSASIRLEDLLTQHAFGRLLAYRLPNGRTVYHRDAILDASRRLDWLEPRVGSILTRAPGGWLPTYPCTPGAKCMIMPSEPLAGCCPPAQKSPNEV